MQTENKNHTINFNHNYYILNIFILYSGEIKSPVSSDWTYKKNIILIFDVENEIQGDSDAAFDWEKWLSETERQRVRENRAQ